jgi:cellulose biosynthesis protein BcsQ
MTTVLATYNIKGGVGKTSAAVSLAYLAARDGARTLLWDLDPQGGSTYLLRIKPRIRGSTRKLLRGRTGVDEVIKGTDYDEFDLLPSDFSYRHMDLALDRFKRPTRRLARVLEPLQGEYDYVFLDCPPSISLLSESVFEAAHALLVPVIPATLSSRTLRQLRDLIGSGSGAGRLQILAFLSMFDARKRLHREVAEELRAHAPELLGAAVPISGEIERMGRERDVVWSFARRGRAAVAYEVLWQDVKARLGEYALAA